MKTRLIIPFFFVSGLSALVYELAWVDRLALVVGGSSYSIGLVLAAYMAGLGGGALYFGRLADRPGSPARRYALLEGGIGLWGLAAPFLLTALQAIYVASHGGGLALRATLGLLALFPATFLMGGTLPVLARGIARDRADSHRATAMLYGWNTAGAVAGVLLAQFYLLDRWGLHGSSQMMGAVNLLLAAAAWLLGPRLVANIRDDESTTELADESSKDTSPHALRIATMGAAIAGLSGLALEVSWSRALGSALGSTRHAFAAVLAATLLGIALGSLYETRRQAKRDSGVMRMSLALSWLGAACAFFLWAYPQLLQILFHFSQSHAFSYDGLVVAQMLLCWLFVLPGAFAMGRIFPLAVGMATESLGRAGRRLGSIYIANTIGAVAGSIAGAFVLLPMLGADGLLRASGAVACVAALVAAAAARRRVLVALVGATVLLSLALLDGWAPERLDLNPTRLRRNSGTISPGQLQDRYITGGLAQLYSREGRNARVSVRATGSIRQLRIGGKTDASAPNDMPTQLLVGTVPFLARPEAKRICVIGLGSGVTASAAAGFSAVETVDVIEIEEAVVEAAQLHFGVANQNVMDDPKVHLVYDDARSYLLTPREDNPYDIIISEPSNPSIAGIANLFSLEHYQNAKRSLIEGGAYIQWIQLYETDAWMLKSMAKTFAAAFEHVDLWWAYPGDLFVLGSDAPLVYQRTKVRELLENNPRLRGELWPRLHIRQPDDIFSRYLSTARENATLFDDGEILRDDYPRLASRAARNRYVDAPPILLMREMWQRYIQRPNKWPLLDGADLPDLLETQALLTAGARYLERVSPDIATSFLADIETPEAWSLRIRMAATPLERQRMLAQAMAMHPEHPLLYLELARLHLDAGDPARAAQILDQLTLPGNWMTSDLSVQRLRVLAVTDGKNAQRVYDFTSDALARLLPRKRSASTRSYLLQRLSEAAVYVPAAFEELHQIWRDAPYDSEAGLGLARAQLTKGNARHCLETLKAVESSCFMQYKPELLRLRVLALALAGSAELPETLESFLHYFPDQIRHPELQAVLRDQL